VLAPNATLRSAVAAIGRPGDGLPDGDTVVHPAPSEVRHEPVTPPTSPARIRWAVLLARIYDVLPLLCPACGGQTPSSSPLPYHHLPNEAQSPACMALWVRIPPSA
jgi:hypothetical protein